MKKLFLKGTLLSILIFFSVSFLTVLFQINSPLHRVNDKYDLSIGFPFRYYHEFMVDYSTPNSGWNIGNLILDCFLTWGVTILILIIQRIRR